MEITWWMWASAALVLAVIEMLGPGFFVIFFAFGAAVTAAALAVAPTLPGWAQLMCFAASSVLALLLFRKRLVAAFGQGSGATTRDVEQEVALPLEDIAPGAVGRAELRGSSWSARNLSETALKKGQRCRVEKVDGLTLNLRAE